MAVVDLRGFDPNDQNDLASTPEPVRHSIRTRALAETYYLAANVLGYTKLRPNTHGPLCVFLDSCQTKRRLIQMPRSHFKSTLVTVTHRIRRVLNNPDLRVLIVGDTETNAQKHLTKIKNHFDRNRLFRWLFPDRIWPDTSQAPTWSKVALFIPQLTRDGEYVTAQHGEPTFDSIGARGAVVSRHYDEINADDLIGEDEYYSSTEMDKTIDWFTGLEALFVPPIEQGLLDIPSTFWRTDDVYAFAEAFYGHGEEPVVTGPYSYQRGEIAVFRRGNVENGVPIFPEAFTMQYYQRLLEKNPERYAAQYANNPFSSELAYFKKEYLNYYDIRSDDGKVLSIRDSQDNIAIVRTERGFLMSMCDPHAGGTASRNKQRFRGTKAAVITTVTFPESGRIFILDCWLKRAPTNEIVDEIIRQNEKWQPEVFSVEANGFQKMLKYWLEERVERDGLLPIPIRPYYPQGDKDGERRIKGLQPYFKNGRIYIHRSMTEFMEEYLAYPRGTVDSLDCLAQGLEHWELDFVEMQQEVDEYEMALRRMRSVATGY